MGLLRNGSSLAMLPIRQIGGGVHADLSMWNRSERRNSSTAFSPLAGIPYGHLAPSSWLLPVKPGGMSSSRFAEVKVSASASGVMGMPASGSASFSVGASAEAQLIANGSGSAGFSVLAAGTLSASLNASGTASFSVSATAAPGALANIGGHAGFSFASAASALPLNDASPLRGGSASFTITGTVEPYAVGIMSGSTVDNATLTPTSIAGAVWSATAAEFTTTGTMGAKLNSAASGGVDYDALADSVWNHGSAAGVAEHLAEVWGRLGLDPSKPLISGQTQISFGDIVMALTGNENQSTVTRQ
jgi:hypothetical protein